MCRDIERTDLSLPAQLHGGIVPHAGWVCSGRIAGGVFRALAQRQPEAILVLLGAVHSAPVRQPAVDVWDEWQTPLGAVPVDTDLRRAMCELGAFIADDMPHRYEHSIEVQLPLAQVAFGSSLRIVPCAVPPSPSAHEWGEAMGRLFADWSQPVVVVASSDLTHYGPNYHYTPAGAGKQGYQWAHQVNDRRLLELVEEMAADRVVADTQEHLSACGGGAIAAGIAAAQQMGARQAYILEHTDSARELASLGYHDRDNSVGYAGVVFG